MAANTDRRRINAPSGGTSAPVFAKPVKAPGYLQSLRPNRTRGPNELRKTCKQTNSIRTVLQTGVVPSASGSAYLEVPTTTASSQSSLIPPTSSLKIAASIQGPKPLPRSAPFSPTLVLTTTVKFAPFATRYRRGYIRDSAERDLGVHLEAALRGVIIGERWPKSGLEVVITILEGDEDAWWGDDKAEGGAGSGWGLLNVLAGCITVASAAIMDASIDCVDMVAGGVAAITADGQKVLEPCPAEHQDLVAACAVGYLASRDEITELWLKGEVGADPDELIEGATHAAMGSVSVLREVLLESMGTKTKVANEVSKRKLEDVEMTG
ncbi:3' exoribonuclease [Paraphaeosphaeria minitans]|uniref:3' exoribonuclease n=1 Tax=Paraphaeosphaeria minitans TaxID=565426 RepID=A0A9P6GPR6_9PLEO|nr:3' exoribonuclease [Paraphaeosphaeria minitans]